MSKKLLNNWVEALFSISQENNNVDLYHDAALALVKLFRTYPGVIKCLSNTRIAASTRKELLEKMFAKRLDPFLVKAFELMVDRNIFYYVINILKYLIKVINNLHHVHYGKVYSVIPLTPTQLQKIEKIMSKRFNNRIILKNVIDEDLIGGLKIQIRNSLIDISVAGKLTGIHRKILLNK